MDYLKLANFYTKSNLIQGVNVVFVDHMDGNGVQIDLWNVPNIEKPTITQLEALQEQLDIQENNDKILNQITELEQSQLRATREMILSPNDTAKARLQNVDNKIADLRNKLK